MAVYPKGERFMASCGAGSTRVRKTFKLESDALVWVAEEEAKRATLEAPEAIPEPTCWTIQQAFDQTLRHQWMGKAGAPKALLNAKQAVDFFGPNTPTNDITSNWILEWMEELQDARENAASTCNKKLSALSVMLKRAETFGGLDRLPKMKRYSEGKHRIVWFTDQEEKLMLETSLKLGFKVLHDYILFAMHTGFRRSELLSLTLKNYHRGSLILHAGSTKSGAARTVTTTDQMKSILAIRQACGDLAVFPGLTQATLRFQWESLRNHLGRSDDPGFIVHVMRHTCATRMVAENINLNVVMAWMGHAVIATTMRYAHLMDKSIAQAGATMNARVPDLIDA